MASESKSANAVCFKSMDLYNNDRSYFIERVIQNCFEDGFEGEHPFKTHRCLDIMSYTRIDSSQHSFPSDYPFTPKIQTPEDLKETLGCSDHELNILEYALPQHKKAPDVEGVAMLDVGCGYGGIARMLKIRYPHIKMVGCEFQPLVRDLARKLTTCTSELPADAIEYWEPEGGDPNSVADVHEFLKTTPDCSFDTVVSFLAVLHIPEKDKLFREFLRVLKPGGRLIIEDLIGTQRAEKLAKEATIPVEALRFSGDVPRTLQERNFSLVESKLIKLQRVVHFSDALTLHEYADKLKAGGFEPVGSRRKMVIDSAPSWGPFVTARSAMFASWTPQTTLREMGVVADGTLAEAVAVPGVYGSDLDWNQWKAHQRLGPGSSCEAKLRGVEGKTYTYLNPSVCPQNFTEPADSIVKSYLECQTKFFQEVHELFNEEACCGGTWVFAQKPDGVSEQSPSKRSKSR